MTRFTELVGCELPLQCAGMGSVGSPDLAIAVSEAGGLGMLGMRPDLASDLARTVARTSKPFGVNFLMPFVDRNSVDLAARTASVVEFFYGDPDASLVSLANAHGAKTGWQIGTVGEAEAAVAAGVDFVTAQGIEAGGHVRGTTPLDELLTATLAAVNVPVVASGGISTPQRVRAVLDAGADAVRVGTAFLAAEEADVHPGYVEALIAAGPDSTVLTEAFDLGWPQAPHRVLRSCIDAGSGSRPPSPPARDAQGDIASMALYAGTGVDAVTRTRPASEIVRELLSS